jgi:hypothetical protein
MPKATGPAATLQVGQFSRHIAALLQQLRLSLHAVLVEVLVLPPLL